MNKINLHLEKAHVLDHYEGKAMSRKELANELGISLSTFYRRLNKIGYKTDHFLLTPRQQIEIIKLLGYD